VNASLDFAVVKKISLNNTEPVLGKDVVGINVTVKNFGVRNGRTSVILYYENRSAGIKRSITEANTSSTDIISLPPGVLGARLHFAHGKIVNGEVTIYDGDGRLVKRVAYSGKDMSGVSYGGWTDWIYGENITIKMELLPLQYHLEYLFDTTNLTWIDDLNNGTILVELRSKLEDYWGIDLSENATVEKEEEKEDEWIIIDESLKRVSIKKVDDKLTVYRYNYEGYRYNGEFTIDEYEALIKEENVTLNASEWKVINASWRTGARYGGARNHSISACIDPHDVFAESNDANNTLSE